MSGLNPSQREANRAIDDLLQTAESLQVWPQKTSEQYGQWLATLKKLLALDPDNRNAQLMLVALGTEMPALRQEAQNILMEIDTPEARVQIDSLELATLRELMTDRYYKGYYKDALNLANAILARLPEDWAATKYHELAQYNMEHGVVHDPRIPDDAKLAYGKGISARNGGQYPEADRMFRDALRIAQEAGLERWGDAERKIAEIAQLQEMSRLRDQGMSLARDDHWQEALNAFEAAKQCASSPRVDELCVLAKKVCGIIQHVQSGSPRERELLQLVPQLAQWQKDLAEAQVMFPGSQLLRDTITPQLDSLVDRAKDLLLKRIAGRMGRYPEANTIASREGLLVACKADFESHAQLNDPGADGEGQPWRDYVAREATRLQEVKSQLHQVRELVSAADKENLDRAAGILKQNYDLANDEGYQLLVRDALDSLLQQSVLRDRDDDLAVRQEFWRSAQYLFDYVLGAATKADPNNAHLSNLRSEYARRLSSRSQELRREQADQLAKTGKVTEAKQILVELLNEDPNSDSLKRTHASLLQNQETKRLRVLGIAAFQAGDYAEAEKHFKAALEYNPEDTELEHLYQEACALRVRLETGSQRLSTAQKWEYRLTLVGVLIFILICIYMVSLILKGI